MYGTGGGGVDGIMTQETEGLLIEYNQIYDHGREDGIDIKVKSKDIFNKSDNVQSDCQIAILLRTIS